MPVQRVHNYGVEELPQEFTCEHAEIGTLPTDVPTHSTCWVIKNEAGTEGGYGLLFDGTSWRAV